MINYYVLVEDVTSKERSTTCCDSNNDLATFLTHLDTDKYKIISISGVDREIAPQDTFLRKNINLETGD